MFLAVNKSFGRFSLVAIIYECVIHYGIAVAGGGSGGAASNLVHRWWSRRDHCSYICNASSHIGIRGG